MMHNCRLHIIIALLMLCVGQIYGKIYLVSAGVGDYSAYPHRANSLRLTVEDAKTMAYIYSKNGDTEYSLLLNKNATRKNILDTVRDLFSKAEKDDIVVFFFSGHGYTGGLCAYDGEIRYSQIRQAMAKCRSENKMMFIDACRSGSLRQSQSNTGSDESAAKSASVMLFLSSRTNESSIERSDMKNGYFTAYLYRGLRGNADANRDRVITAKELYDFVHTGVSRISSDQQHPVMWGKFRDSMPVMKW